MKVLKFADYERLPDGKIQKKKKPKELTPEEKAALAELLKPKSQRQKKPQT